MEGMIFAAGLGTRLRPLTNDRPKALVELGGKTLLERVVERLYGAGIRRIVINIYHFAELVEREVERLRVEERLPGVELIISDEREQLLDTGGGLLAARGYFTPGEPLLLHNVDIWSELDLRAIVEHYESSPCHALLAVRASGASCLEGHKGGASGLEERKGGVVGLEGGTSALSGGEHRSGKCEGGEFSAGRQEGRVLRFGNDGILRGWSNLATGEIRRARENFDAPDGAFYGFCGIAILSPQFINSISHEGVFSIIDEYLAQGRTHDIYAYPYTGPFADLGTPSDLLSVERLLAK